jgi:hypothetical protein
MLSGVERSSGIFEAPQGLPPPIYPPVEYVQFVPEGVPPFDTGYARNFHVLDTEMNSLRRDTTPANGYRVYTDGSVIPTYSGLFDAPQGLPPLIGSPLEQLHFVPERVPPCDISHVPDINVLDTEMNSNHACDASDHGMGVSLCNKMDDSRSSSSADSNDDRRSLSSGDSNDPDHNTSDHGMGVSLCNKMDDSRSSSSADSNDDSRSLSSGDSNDPDHNTTASPDDPKDSVCVRSDFSDDECDEILSSVDNGSEGTEVNESDESNSDSAAVVYRNFRQTLLVPCPAPDDDHDSDESYSNIVTVEEEKQEATDEADLRPVFGNDPVRDTLNHFLPPVEENEALLSQVEINFDCDSIVGIAKNLSKLLRWIGCESGTCDFQSSVDRIRNSKSSRIAVDYRAREDLQPPMTGRRVRTLKLVSLENFPNIQLFVVNKGSVKFLVCLHILEPVRVSDANFINHEILLTLICALNIALDGDFPWPDEERETEERNEHLHHVEWSRLPYFELQDGSTTQKKNSQLS